MFQVLSCTLSFHTGTASPDIHLISILLIHLQGWNWVLVPLIPRICSGGTGASPFCVVDLDLCRSVGICGMHMRSSHCGYVNEAEYRQPGTRMQSLASRPPVLYIIPMPCHYSLLCRAGTATSGVQYAVPLSSESLYDTSCPRSLLLPGAGVPVAVLLLVSFADIQKSIPIG